MEEFRQHIHCSKCLDAEERDDVIFLQRWDVVLCKFCAKKLLKELEEERDLGRI